MKRGKRLIILLALLVLAVGGYLMVSRLAEKGKDEGEKSVAVYSIDSTNITQISWTYLGENVTLFYDRSNDKWIYTGDESFPVDSTYPETMRTSLASITADRALSDVTDYNEYGFDNPNAVITITDSNGGATKFTIGDQNTSTSGYYFRVNDESTVYLIGSTLPEAFFHKLNDIVAMEKIPAIDNVSQITVESSGKTNSLVMLDQDEREKYSYTTDYAWYYKQPNGGYSPIDGDMAENIISTASGITWGSCADYNATEDELQSYGLKNPYAKVTVNYKQKASSDSGTQETQSTFTLLIGNKTESSYYAKLPESSMVYLISADSVDTLTNTDYAALRTSDVCLMDWSTVDSMDVTVDGKTSTISFNRAKTGSDDSTTTTTYTVDGNEVQSDAVTAFLSAIRSLTSDSTTNKGTYSEKGDVVIVFHRNTESFKTMTMTFSSYDDSYYLLSFNGEARLLINKSNVESLKSSFNSIK